MVLSRNEAENGLIHKLSLSIYLLPTTLRVSIKGIYKILVYIHLLLKCREW